MKKLTPLVIAATVAAGCGTGGTTGPDQTANAAHRAQASATAPAGPAGCQEAVRIIAEIRQHLERLGENDGFQASVWAGQWSKEVMSAELGKRNTAVVSELWSGLTTIAIAFREDTPRAVEDNQPKVDAAAETILLTCNHAS